MWWSLGLLAPLWWVGVMTTLVIAHSMLASVYILTAAFVGGVAGFWS